MSTAEEISGAEWKISGIELVIGDAVADTWGKVTYDLPADKSETGRYITMLSNQLSLYPAGYHVKAGISKIVLGRNLAFNDEYRGAVPDPYRKTLYLSVNGSYGESGDTYLVHVLHHELHHMMEYSAWKNMYFDWVQWNKLNPEGFVYGTGGTGYMETEPDYYSVTHPLNGFLNLYSMTGGEEDRCEIVSFLMSVMQRPFLLRYYSSDSILRRKIRFISDFVNNFAGEKFIDIESIFGPVKPGD
jgi:hypothetical protein